MLQVFVPDWSFVFKFQILRNRKVQLHKSSNIHFAYCKTLICVCHPVNMEPVERNTMQQTLIEAQKALCHYLAR